MSKEAIIKIKQAEAEAQRIRTDAEAEARKRIRAAEERGSLACEKAETEAARINSERLRITRQKAEELTLIAEQAAKAQAEELAAASEQNMKEAVRAIIEGALKECR